MDRKKLLTNVVLGGVCFISLSFANTAMRELRISHPPVKQLEIPDDDDSDRDEMSNNYSTHDPLNTEKKVRLLKIELQEKNHSLTNLSYDSRTILIPDARLTLLEMELHPEAHSPETLIFDERLTLLESEILRIFPQGDLGDITKTTLSEMGIPSGSYSGPLSLDERATLSLEDRLTLLEMELSHYQHFPPSVRSVIERDRDSSPESQMANAIEAIDDPFQNIIRLLVVNSVDVNLKYPTKYCWNASLLHVAAIQRCGLEIVRFLLNYGADINILDSFKENALHSAIRRGNFPTIEFLIEHGIDVHAKNDDNQNALHIAVDSSSPSVKIVRLLIAGKVDCNATDDDGRTPLALAIEKREETSDEEGKKIYDAIIDELRPHTL